MTIATPLKKVTPLSPRNPPVKAEVLSSPPFSKFGWRLNPSSPPYRKGGGAHYEWSVVITFSSKRKVNDKSYLICTNRKSIAEETTVKLLGVKTKTLTWSSHVNSIVIASCGILRTLETLQTLHSFQGT